MQETDKEAITQILTGACGASGLVILAAAAGLAAAAAEHIDQRQLVWNAAKPLIARLAKKGAPPTPQELQSVAEIVRLVAPAEA
jgi:hypothetical protein